MLWQAVSDLRPSHYSDEDRRQDDQANDQGVIHGQGSSEGATSGSLLLSAATALFSPVVGTRDYGRMHLSGSNRPSIGPGCKDKRDMFDRLHQHLNRLADEVEQAMRRRAFHSAFKQAVRAARLS
jgi:hypothetical protein